MIILADPVTAPLTLGPSLGAVVVCIALFVWSQIQFALFGRDLKTHMKDDDKNFSDLKNLSIGGMNNYTQIGKSITDMAGAVKSNGEAIMRIAENQSEQLVILREMNADSKVLIANQTMAQTALQHLLEKVVDKLAA